MAHRINLFLIFLIIALIAFAIPGCAEKSIPLQSASIDVNKTEAIKMTGGTESNEIKSALAIETFLADITRNISGDRLTIYSLMPIGMDPHEFEPVPKDFASISNNRILIINGSGFEGWLEQMLKNSGSSNYIIEASKGLGEISDFKSENDAKNINNGETADKLSEIDPHFWLDPVYAIEYVKNISSELVKIDPGGKDIYESNGQKYIEELKNLDMWTRDRVSILPEGKRIIATNHESLGYFAKRYGFEIAGTIIPGFSTDVSITAREFALLIENVRSSGVKVIFLETGANPKLAEQLAEETGIKVVYNLYTHSLSDAGGNASTYIDMMKFNVNTIVNNLQ